MTRDEKALARVKAWLADAIDGRRVPHDYIPRFGHNILVPYADLRAVLALAERSAEQTRRAALATRYLKTISSGQFVTASLVVAAIRTLDMSEPLPLSPARPRAKGRRR